MIPFVRNVLKNLLTGPATRNYPAAPSPTGHEYRGLRLLRAVRPKVSRRGHRSPARRTGVDARPLPLHPLRRMRGGLPEEVPVDEAGLPQAERMTRHAVTSI